MNSNNPDLTKKTNSSINAPSKLFKPIIITKDLIKKSESNISSNFTTMPQLSSIHNEKNIPLFYHQYPLGSSPQIPSIYYPEMQIAKFNDIKNKPCCSCNKTRCIKKYCECFANNKICNNCICPDCLNRDIYMTNLYKNEKINSKDIIFCTCSKSGCNKKYCECFKANLKCNIKCRCVNCLNINDIIIKNSNDINENHNKIISLEETNSESRKKSLNSETNGFSIQRISILIIKNQTLINVDKLNVNEIGFLGNKRKKS